MNTSTKLLTFLMLLISNILNAQIKNSDFEDWNGNSPLFWYTSNNPMSVPGSINITRTTKAQNGMYAVRGEALYTQWGPHNPSVTTNDIWDNDNQGFPISVNPVALGGHFIYKPVSEDEYFYITALLINQRGDEASVVGVASRTYANTIFLDSNYTEFNIPFNYYLLEQPNIIQIDVGINSRTEGSVFYLDNLSLSYINIITPVAGDIIIASEKYKIRWAAIADNVNIKYSLDNGTTFTSIENDYPADSNKYVWDVPKELLSSKAVIRVEDSQDNLKYDQRYVMIKPWQLTRIDANGDFDLYELSQNEWSFNQIPENIWPINWWEQFNYYSGTDLYTNAIYPSRFPFRTALSDDFPDWPIFVKAFGGDQCYIGDYDYGAEASSVWHGLKGNYNGACFGLTVSSLLCFYHLDYMKSNYSSVGIPDNIHELSVNDSIRKIIHKYHILQVAQPILDYKRFKQTLSARQTLQELKDMLSKNNNDASILSYFGNNPPGGHAVIPYKLERRDNSSIFDLWVYDPNPGSGSADKITFDSTANTWTDDTGIGWSGNSACYLNPSTSVFKEKLLLRNLNPSFSLLKSTEKLESKDLTLFNNSFAEITISNSEGKIGYENNAVNSTIQNASPIIPITGSPHPPIGYILPNGDYSIQINNFKDSSSYLLVLDESTIYNYRRFDAKNSETDIINFSDGLRVKSIDPTIKNITLETIIEDEISEKVFVVSNLKIGENDSIHINENNRDKLEVQNFGSEKNYNIQIRNANANESKEFNSFNISLASNSTHHVIPIWDNLELDNTIILVDIGNDGSIDDSLFVNNQLTYIENKDKTEIPTNYSLSQNYPNPFNPTTTIEYSIPFVETRHTSTTSATVLPVQLKVYDVLGNEVATLVNERQSAGSYKVEFDGSKFTSGVYLIKLTAGNFVQTRKMTLVK